MNCRYCDAPNEPSADTCFQCGRSLVTLTQGTVVDGRYEVLGVLGRGGMGVVYEARDRELDELVALKAMRAEIADSEDAARRFRTEIKLARRVRHRNVCAIHEYGQDRHVRYIAMELVRGVDLRAVVRRLGALEPDQAYAIAIQVVDGLGAIHEVGVVHRDLKSPNIMLDGRGLVRLMDFGIAKRLDAETTGATATGQVVGTPEYMSPEQALGEKLDPRSDLYALGIVVFEIFTGAVPFRGDTPIATLFQQIHTPPPLRGPAAARLPRALVPVLARLLAKNRAERFGTAEAAAEALRAAAAADLGAGPRPEVLKELAARVGAGAPAVSGPTPPVAPPAPAPPRAEVPAGEGGPDGSPRETEALSTPEPPPRGGPAVAGAEPPAATPGRASRLAGGAILAGLVVAGLVGLAAAMWLGSRGSVPDRAVPPVTSASEHPPATPNEGRGVAGSPVGLVATAPVTTRPGPVAAAVPVRPGPPASLRGRSGLEPTATPTVAPSLAPARVVSAPPPEPRPTAPVVPSAAPSAAAPAAPAPAPATTRPPTTTPPTVAPARVRGRLTIKSKPSATVSVDGVPAGRTPVALLVEAGRRQVEFTHEDYEPLKRVVTVGEGQAAEVAVDLRDEARRRKK